MWGRGKRSGKFGWQSWMNEWTCLTRKKAWREMKAEAEGRQGFLYACVSSPTPSSLISLCLCLLLLTWRWENEIRKYTQKVWKGFDNDRMDLQKKKFAVGQGRYFSHTPFRLKSPNIPFQKKKLTCSQSSPATLNQSSWRIKIVTPPATNADTIPHHLAYLGMALAKFRNRNTRTDECYPRSDRLTMSKQIFLFVAIAAQCWSRCHCSKLTPRRGDQVSIFSLRRKPCSLSS